MPDALVTALAAPTITERGTQTRRLPSLNNTRAVNGSLEATLQPMGDPRQSEPGRLGLVAPLGPEGLVDQLDEARPVHQLDGVLGGELLGRERERARGHEEALVAQRMMDGAEELLEHGRAHHALLVILALDDSEQAVAAAEAEIGALVPAAAHRLDLVAERLEELRDELLERLGGQRGELGELQVGAARLVVLPLDAFPA